MSKSMSDWLVLPPASGKCRVCAIAHLEELPHDATTFYYRMLFVNSYGRSPTWRDAMAHCEPDVQQVMAKRLESFGIDIDSTKLLGNIKDEKDMEARLKQANK